MLQQGLQRLSSVPMPVWFWGLNVCMWGQMDTFMRAWVWIILQATSGAPHGTADCSKRGRWARGEGTPPEGSLTSILTDRASLQMAAQKVMANPAEQMLGSSQMSFSVLAFLCVPQQLPVPRCHAVDTHWDTHNSDCSVLLKDTVMWTKEAGIGTPLLWLMADHLSYSCL